MQIGAKVILNFVAHERQTDLLWTVLPWTALPQLCSAGASMFGHLALAKTRLMVLGEGGEKEETGLAVSLQMNDGNLSQQPQRGSGREGVFPAIAAEGGVEVGASITSCWHVAPHSSWRSTGCDVLLWGAHRNRHRSGNDTHVPHRKQSRNKDSSSPGNPNNWGAHTATGGQESSAVQGAARGREEERGVTSTCKGLMPSEHFNYAHGHCRPAGGSAGEVESLQASYH